MAIQKVLEWYTTGQWKKKPCVIWGPSGTGKTLLCMLLAAKFKAQFVTYEDEFDVIDKIKGWMQSATSKGVGLLSFTTESETTPVPSWLLIDDLDSLETQCRKDVLPFIKKHKQLPGPILITCYNLHDTHMAAVKSYAAPQVQLKLHTLENLKKLVRTVSSTLSESQVSQVASWSCGDARRCIMETRLLSATSTCSDVQQPTSKVRHRLDLHQDEVVTVVHHSPFAAVSSLMKHPEIHSRALDGQEFFVTNLMYQNYPKCMNSGNMNSGNPNSLRDLFYLGMAADAICEYDLLDSCHELPEYARTYMTFVVPTYCKAGLQSRRAPDIKLNSEQLRGTFDRKKKVCLDWNCLQKC